MSDTNPSPEEVLLDKALATRDYLRENGADPSEHPLSEKSLIYRDLDQALRPFDQRTFVFVDFNNMVEPGQVGALVEDVSNSRPEVGMEVVLDDCEGTRCLGKISEIHDNKRTLWIEVDSETFMREDLFLSEEFESEAK